MVRHGVINKKRRCSLSTPGININEVKPLILEIVIMTTGNPKAIIAPTRLIAMVIVIIAYMLCVQCSTFSSKGTVIKPRVHRSHYKKSSSKNWVGIGRYSFKVPNFERSGVKKVKMK
jgi:hypothetical protein